jgi:anti-anti-sigma factor
MGSFTCTADQQAGIGRITLAGELDVSVAERLEQALSLIEDAPIAVLDLREVRFIDAAGVEALVQARRRAGEDGRHLLLLPSPRVRRVMELVGLDDSWLRDRPDPEVTRR